LALAGAALLSFALRLAHLMDLQGSPLLSGLMGDSRQYDAWAQEIAGGNWAGTQVFYQAPLYPYSLALVFTVFGHDLDVVRLVQAALGAASCALLGLAGRRFFSNRAGVAAALLLAVYPPAIFFDGLIQKSSLDIFLITLMLALLGEFGARRDWKWLAALGVVTAALVLNRENARVLFPVTGAWLWFGFPDVAGRRRAAGILVFAAASLAVLVPVGFRNYRVGGELLVSTSQAGPNFYIGNNPHASGTYEPLLPERGDPLFERDDATRLASAAAGRSLSPSEVSDYWLGRSFAYIRSQPFHWLGLMGKKALLTLNAADLPDTESIEAYAGYSRILRGLFWLNFGVILPLAVFGAWVSRKEWRRLLVLYGMFAGLVLAVAAFYVVARYRHPLVPIVLLFAAAGLHGVLGLCQGAPWRAATPARRGSARHAAVRAAPVSSTGWKREWLPGLAGAGMVAIAVNVPIIEVRDQTFLNLGSLLAQRGRAVEAIDVLSKAVAIDPGHAEPHFRLGLARRDAGQQQEAIEELTAAVRLRPDHADAHAALGVLLRGEGRTAESLAHFREAVRHAPDSFEARTNLGLALMEAGRPGEAVAEHRRAIAMAPDLASPHNNLAMALLQAGGTSDAVSEYRAALALDPGYVEAHVNLAMTLARSREFDEAFLHFREAVRLQPDSHEVRLRFGGALCDAGRTEEGIEQYEAALRLLPDSVDALSLAAQAYARAGRLAEAVASLERALSLAPAAGSPDAAQGIRDAITRLKAQLPRRSG
jgi:tetratricopeptide (TPR) repeat protein/4-amino-4-deoxy-L-arabinose transferase-like glycosyltransferase